MKQTDKEWHRIHAKNLERRNKSKSKGKNNSFVERATDDFEVIQAPKIICLFNPEKHARRYFLKFLSKLDRSKNMMKTTINFSKTSMIYPCGAAALYATVDRLKSRNAQLSVSGYRSNNRVNQVLQQIGLLDLITPNLPKVKIDREDVVHWSLNKGARINPAEIRIFIEENIAGRDISEEAKKTLRKAIMESIENTQQWAYPDRAMKPWWVLWQIKNNNLVICVCDLGITIPTSLENTWKESISDVFKSFHVTSKNQNTDGRMIERATQVSRSATRQSHRGHGFGKILEFGEMNNGIVRIYSAKGIFYKSWKKPSKETRATRQRLDGTLIHWNIEINEQKGH